MRQQLVGARRAVPHTKCPLIEKLSFKVSAFEVLELNGLRLGLRLAFGLLRCLGKDCANAHQDKKRAVCRQPHDGNLSVSGPIGKLNVDREFPKWSRAACRATEGAFADVKT